MKTVDLERLVVARAQRLEDRLGKRILCFAFHRPHGAEYTLMMFVACCERRSVMAAIQTADRWYVDYDLNYQSYLQLRRNLGYLLRKL